MRTKLIWLSGAGVAVLGLAISLAVRSVDQGGTGGRSSDLVGAGDDAAVGKLPGSARNRPHGLMNAAHAPKVRKVALNPDDFTELDWSVDELDGFLKTKSSQITGKEMVSLLVYLLPAPIGAEDSPSRLKPGSIQLRDQVRLCMKYLNTQDQRSLFFLLFSRYSKTSSGLDEYRRDAVEQMPPGWVRAGEMAGYYCHKYTDLSSIREMLASDELPNLIGREGAPLAASDSDYTGAVNGVQSSLTNILERGDATAQEIVDALTASKLDETSKLRIIQSIKRRGAEVEILRNEAKANKGNKANEGK
jgi:hypothetical protein